MERLYKSRFIVAIVCAVILLYSIIFNFVGLTAKNSKADKQSGIITVNEKSEDITVFVGGAVENEGWHSIAANGTYYDLFEICIPAAEADLSGINLYEKVCGGSKIIIKSLLFYDCFDINAADEFEMAAAGLSIDIILKIIDKRGSVFLSKDNVTETQFMTVEEYNKFRYIFYSYSD